MVTAHGSMLQLPENRALQGLAEAMVFGVYGVYGVCGDRSRLYVAVTREQSSAGLG